MTTPKRNFYKQFVVFGWLVEIHIWSTELGINAKKIKPERPLNTKEN